MMTTSLDNNVSSDRDIRYWQNRILEKISNSNSTSDNIDSIDNNNDNDNDNDIIRIIEEAFNEAYEYCPNIILICDYLDMYTHHYDNDNNTIITDNDMRNAFEKAISICGIDIIDGNIVWKRYRDFEIQEHLNNIQDGVSQEELQISKIRVIKVFTRNLSIPLSNNEQCLYEYNQLLEDICVDTDESIIQPSLLQEKYQYAIQLLTPRLIYEERLHQSSLTIMNNNNKDNTNINNDENDKIEIWKKYIELEILDEKYSRAQRLFERALMAHDNIDLWIRYTEFAVNDLKNWQLVLSITNRGLKLHPSSVIFWKFYLISMEQTTTDILGINEKVNEIVDKAIHSSFPEAQDFITILTLKCDYRRRLMSSISEAPKDSNQLVDVVRLVRDSFNELENFLETYYPTWESEWIKLVKYRARVEDEGITNIIDALAESNSKHKNSIRCESTACWEKLVLRFPNSYYSWTEFISWAIKGGEYGICRKLFRNALKTAVEYSEQICNEWVAFEQQCGTLKTYLDATESARLISKNSKKQIPIQETAHKLEAAVSKGKKRELEENMQSNSTTKKMKVETSNNIKTVKEKAASLTSTVKEKAPSQTSPNQHPTTLFVTKFPKNLTDQGLSDLFSRFGTIVAAHVVKDKSSGESKGHGLVQFSNEKEKEAARSLHQTVVDGHVISVLPSKFPALLEKNAAPEQKEAQASSFKSSLTFKPRGIQNSVKKSKISLN